MSKNSNSKKSPHLKCLRILTLRNLKLHDSKQKEVKKNARIHVWNLINSESFPFNFNIHYR